MMRVSCFEALRYIFALVRRGFPLAVFFFPRAQAEFVSPNDDSHLNTVDDAEGARRLQDLLGTVHSVYPEDLSQVSGRR